MSGIFPPDIGGPATHVSDLREELRARGHDVVVLTLGDVAGLQDRDGVVRVPRAWAWPARFCASVWWLAAHASTYDVIYATGLQPEAVLAARLTGRPVVVKVVGDPAWERGQREGLTLLNFNMFVQSRGGPVRLRLMRLVRDAWLRAADEVTAPSQFLAATIEGWLDGPAGVTVIPNGVRLGTVRRSTPLRETLRAIWVGRLVPLKRVDRLIEAVARTTGVSLRIVGDGPERGRLEALAARHGTGDRISFLGVLARDEAFKELAASHVLLLASEVEGLPHVVIEAFSLGVPLVGTGAGGTAEVLRDHENGLLVPDAAVEGFAAALARLRDEVGLQERLGRGAAREGEKWRFERTADGVEFVLAKAMARRPRAVFLGKTRLPTPLPSDLQKKLSILIEHFDPVVVGIGKPGLHRVGRGRVLLFPDVRPSALGGAIFYAVAPFVALAFGVRGRRAAIVCQSPLEAFGVVALSRLVDKRVRPRTVVEVHGDWRTATRLYGSPRRRWLSPLVDRFSVWAIRNADRVRVVGRYTLGLVQGVGFAGPTDTYVAYNDPEAFLAEPPVPFPERPVVLFVGVLEANKGVDVLVDAWLSVHLQHPQAELRIVGGGRLRSSVQDRVEELALGSSVRFLGRVPRSRVAREMDRCTLLVLPSRSEGLGLVVLEAMARGRPVVASRVGGISESVEDGVSGVLVPPDDPIALAHAIAGLLRDPATCRRFGELARHRAELRNPATGFEAGIARAAEWVSRS